MRNRRVDFNRLSSHPATLLHRDSIQGAHIVSTIGQLDQNDPDIARHRHKHFAEAFSLRLSMALKLQLIKLGQALD